MKINRTSLTYSINNNHYRQTTSKCWTHLWNSSQLEQSIIPCHASM